MSAELTDRKLEDKKMSSKKLIAVFGATGKQGGSVVTALLNEKEKYDVRAITRNVNGEKAQHLKTMGVEVVYASMDEPNTLCSAVAGSHGVFIVTNFWEHKDKDREILQGKNVVDTCKEAGVTHVIFSGLEKVQKITGKSCPHFDGKGEVEEYIQSLNVPHTIVRYPYYYENTFIALGFLGFQKGDNGSYAVTSCLQGEMDTISVENTGPIIASIFSEPENYLGKTIGISGERLTAKQYFDIIAKATGKKIHVNTMSVDDYAKLPFPGADDLAAMFHFYDNGNPVRDMKLTKQLDPETPSFLSWATDNKIKFIFE